MEMQLQTKDTLATLHLDPRTKLYLLIVGNVALFLAPSLLYEIALVVCVVILGVLTGAKRFTVRMAAVYAGMGCSAYHWNKLFDRDFADCDCNIYRIYP